jgi:hypothetical protein
VFIHPQTKSESIFKFFKLKLHLVFLLLIFPVVLTAQNSHSAFETLSLGVNYQSNINRNDFHKYWLSDGGIEGYFSTPFYFGNTQFGITYMSFSANSDDQPDFNSLLFYLQWGYKFSLPLNSSLALNASTGLFQMNFDDSDLYVDPGLLSERELSVGLKAILSYAIYNDWYLNLQLNYLNVFTYKKIQLINLGLGISKTFRSPQWIKDFFN